MSKGALDSVCVYINMFVVVSFHMCIYMCVYIICVYESF